MVDIHGYVPRNSKKKYKAGQLLGEASEYESIQPWHSTA